MRKKLRILLIAVVAIVALLVAVPFLIPVNKFRPIMSRPHRKRWAAKFPSATEPLADLRFADRQGPFHRRRSKFSPSPFLTAKSLSVGVEISP